MPPTSSTNRSSVHKNPTRNSTSRADMNSIDTSSGLPYSQLHRPKTLFGAERISTSAPSHARSTDAPSSHIAHSTHIAEDRVQAHVNRVERVFGSERAALWKEGVELRRDVQALLWEHRHVDLVDSSDTTGTAVELTQTEATAIEGPHDDPSAQAHSGFVSMWGLPDVSPETNTAGSKHPPSPHTQICNTEINPRTGNTVTEATEEPAIREQPAIQEAAPKKRKTSE